MPDLALSFTFAAGATSTGERAAAAREHATATGERVAAAGKRVAAAVAFADAAGARATDDRRVANGRPTACGATPPY